MKRSLAVLALSLLALPSLAQERGETKATVAGKAVSIDYGRPVLAGRDMLGLAQVGTPWRMGSGSPTSLKTEADLTFGSTTIAKGSYILTAVKDEKGSWTLIASTPPTTPETPVKQTRVPLTSTVLMDSVEKFTIEITAKDKAGEFAMTWGTSKMAATFTGK